MQLKNNFESGSNGTTISVSNSASPNAWSAVTGPGNGVSAVAYNSAIVANGLLSGKFQSGAGAGTDFVNWAQSVFGTQTTWYGRVYINITGATPTQNRSGMKTNANVRWAISTARKIELYNGGATVGATSTTIIPTGQWVRIEWKIIHHASAGSFEMKIFLTPNSLTPDETFSFTNANTTSAGCTAVNFGIWTSVVNHPEFYLDDIEVNNTGYPGPLAGTESLINSNFFALM